MVSEDDAAKSTTIMCERSNSPLSIFAWMLLKSDGVEIVIMGLPTVLPPLMVGFDRELANRESSSFPPEQPSKTMGLSYTSLWNIPLCLIGIGRCSFCSCRRRCPAPISASAATSASRTAVVVDDDDDSMLTTLVLSKVLAAKEAQAGVPHPPRPTTAWFATKDDAAGSDQADQTRVARAIALLVRAIAIFWKGRD